MMMMMIMMMMMMMMMMVIMITLFENLIVSCYIRFDKLTVYIFITWISTITYETTILSFLLPLHTIDFEGSRSRSYWGVP